MPLAIWPIFCLSFVVFKRHAEGHPRQKSSSHSLRGPKGNTKLPECNLNLAKVDGKLWFMEDAVTRPETAPSKQLQLHPHELPCCMLWLRIPEPRGQAF